MRFLLFFLPVFLMAHVIVALPKKFSVTLPEETAKQFFKNVKDINFDKSIAVLSYNDLPYIIEHNLTIITPIKNLNLYIISKKSLKDIKSVGNVNLPVEIFFHVFNKKIEFSKDRYLDFLNSKIDAFVLEFPKKGYYNYDLSKYGIAFNKYFLVGKKEYINANKNDIEFISAYLNEKYPTDKFRAVNSLLLTSLYLHKKINLPEMVDFKLGKVLKKCNLLRVIVTPNWPPFDIYENGELKGIGIDFWKLIAKKAHLKYHFIIQPVWLKVLESIKNKTADLTPNTSQTPDRQKYAIFSKPYVKFPLAIVCKDKTNINSIANIKSLAVGYNFTAHKLMKQHYPDLKYVPAKNTFDALRLVEENKAECAVDILPTIVWYINNYHLVGFKIAKTTDFTFNLQVMIRKDLVEVKKAIDEAIDKITPQEKDSIINRYIGIKLYTKKNDTFKFFIIIALIFAVVLILLRKLMKYKAEAQIDALTKIYNRGTIEKLFKRMLKENGGSVIFFDIDHFKNVNDTYGHEFGDFVLENLSLLVKDNIRSSDLFGRWGGEEFLIILPKTKYEDALKIAEKLRKIIKNTPFKDVKITSSFGVSEFKKGESVEEVISRADKALYEAKANGRDQVKGIK
jgi:diguanylate cyclase (GGDEF)-like protein